MCANLEKWNFGMSHVQHLGYIIDELGLYVDPTMIQVIQDWPAPTTLMELHTFLGLASFYQRFLLIPLDSPISLDLLFKSPRVEQKKSYFGLNPNRRHFLSWRIASTLHECSHYHTFNNHFSLRQMPSTMILVQFLLNRGIQWHITVRHF